MQKSHRLPVPAKLSLAPAATAATRLRKHALAALALLAGTVAGRAAEPAGFPERLDRHLGSMVAYGILSEGAAAGIGRDFRGFAERNPETLRQAGFEHAIPSVAPAALNRAAGSLSGQEPARPVHEVLGTRTVREDDLPETFRRMFAPTKEDGTHFDMFVKDAYLAQVRLGNFRNADGTVDKRAVSESVRRDKSAYGIVAAELEAMRRDGSGKRLASAINGMVAYAERKGLAFAPTRVRAGLVHMQTCIGAKPDTDPALYAGSCGQTMTWMGERGQAGTVEVRLYNSQTGKAGPGLALAPWDPKYSQEAYGPVFTDTQANSNDAFWRRHFRLYMGTAEAKEATLNARDSDGLLKLETAVGYAMKLLFCLAQGTPFEGRKVVLADVQAALDEAKSLKIATETTAGPAFKARDGYLDTMRGFEQVRARAGIAGIR